MKIGVIAPSNSIVGLENIKIFNEGIELLKSNGFE